MKLLLRWQRSHTSLPAASPQLCGGSIVGWSFPNHRRHGPEHTEGASRTLPPRGPAGLVDSAGLLHQDAHLLDLRQQGRALWTALPYGVGCTLFEHAADM